jgi:hypothetical protein
MEAKKLKNTPHFHYQCEVLENYKQIVHPLPMGKQTGKP